MSRFGGIVGGRQGKDRCRCPIIGHRGPSCDCTVRASWPVASPAMCYGRRKFHFRLGWCRKRGRRIRRSASQNNRLAPTLKFPWPMPSMTSAIALSSRTQRVTAGVVPIGRRGIKRAYDFIIIINIIKGKVYGGSGVSSRERQGEQKARSRMTWQWDAGVRRGLTVIPSFGHMSWPCGERGLAP